MGTLRSIPHRVAQVKRVYNAVDDVAGYAWQGSSTRTLRANTMAGVYYAQQAEPHLPGVGILHLHYHHRGAGPHTA